MDRLDELQLLVAIVDAGSLAAASRRLGRSPAAVTRGLAALEERIGVRLVERTTRRLAPTDAGSDLVEAARRLLLDYEASVGAAASGPIRGLLRITAPLVFGRRHVTPVVSSFLALHPGVSVELRLHDRYLDLIEERLHVGVRIGPLKDSGLVVRRVGQVRHVLVAAPSYLASRPVPITPADLALHDTILNTGAGVTEEWRFGPRTRPLRIRVAPRLRVNEVEAALQAVRDGRGIARPLSYQVAEEVGSGRMVRLLRDYEPEPLPVQLVVPSGRALAPKVRAFLDHAVAQLSALPAIHDL